MSPTSYQLLYPATLVFRRAKSNIAQPRYKVNPDSKEIQSRAGELALLFCLN